MSQILTIEDCIQYVVSKVQASSKIQSVKDYLTTLSKDVEGIPHYLDGHPTEINLRLIEKGKDSVYKFKRYPLIALRLDVQEEVYSGLIHYRLNLGIFAFTDKNYTSAQRREKVFKPILYPLYDEFLRQLKLSGLFLWSGELKIPKHKKFDRYFYGTGTDNGNTKNIFADPLDAIEILDLEINRNVNTCRTIGKIFDSTFDSNFN